MTDYRCPSWHIHSSQVQHLTFRWHAMRQCRGCYVVTLQNRVSLTQTLTESSSSTSVIIDRRRSNSDWASFDINILCFLQKKLRKSIMFVCFVISIVLTMCQKLYTWLPWNYKWQTFLKGLSTDGQPSSRHIGVRF